MLTCQDCGSSHVGWIPGFGYRCSECGNTFEVTPTVNVKVKPKPKPPEETVMLACPKCGEAAIREHIGDNAWCRCGWIGMVDACPITTKPEPTPTPEPARSCPVCQSANLADYPGDPSNKLWCRDCDVVIRKAKPTAGATARINLATVKADITSAFDFYLDHVHRLDYQGAKVQAGRAYAFLAQVEAREKEREAEQRQLNDARVAALAIREILDSDADGEDETSAGLARIDRLAEGIVTGRHEAKTSP